MIDKRLIERLVEEVLQEGMFLVDISVTPANAINVAVDSISGITIEQCVQISRHIEKELDREVEDFELQVSSPGLTEPFKVWEQYLKNVGREIEITLQGGEKITGELKDAGDKVVEIEAKEYVKIEGKKRKEMVLKKRTIACKDIISAKVVVLFK